MVNMASQLYYIRKASKSICLKVYIGTYDEVHVSVSCEQEVQVYQHLLSRFSRLLKEQRKKKEDSEG